jgi:hypothetical protein
MLRVPKCCVNRPKVPAQRRRNDPGVFVLWYRVTRVAGVANLILEIQTPLTGGSLAVPSQPFSICHPERSGTICMRIVPQIVGYAVRVL